ncbi:uncharacterized protein LACBIDRAFT_307617 [Laccaria bicolor S238N-H82]|uniref:Predicted protein n=1 Tax=Laccaria bicolor (strain S238N-H82 / ATCC MYA-4686) TaxID=486041 RepID=B0DQK8_LACBS|nr:uncharacterized protein LACBIDRAFT_307617 [Laccaria bicolor S238N-H82]EDR03132.1 predicted protein [Laccaria bicolor S238N-H82]|eukprot:XP_001886273.1 predicted protein [Laccaria bicolor S238N-H82]
MSNNMSKPTPEWRFWYSSKNLELGMGREATSVYGARGFDLPTRSNQRGSAPPSP